MAGRPQKSNRVGQVSVCGKVLIKQGIKWEGAMLQSAGGQREHERHARKLSTINAFIHLRQATLGLKRMRLKHERVGRTPEGANGFLPP